MPRGIFLIFMSFGVAIAGGTSFYYAWCWSQIVEARTWPATQAVIGSIDIEEHVSASSRDSRPTPTYYPRLVYSYDVAGSTLHGARIWFTGNQFYNHREDAEAFVRRYAIGQSVPVVYDPRNPGDSALLVENPPWQILLGTVFGLLWIGLSLFFRLTDQNAGEAPHEADAPPLSAQPGLVNALRARLGCIIFSLLFGGMWIVAIIVFLSAV